MVTRVIQQLELTFGNKAPLTKTCGKLHDYLGMVIDYTTPGKVRFTMNDYVENMLSELPDDMGGE